MIETKQVQYAKELDDALALVVTVVQQLRAGKSAADIISQDIPLLVNAISGLDQVDAELQANFEVAVATIGGRFGELVAAFLKKPVVPV